MVDDEVLFPTWDEGYTRSKRPKRTTNPDSSPSLVKYLEDELLLNRQTTGLINKAAVMGAFTQWKRNGITGNQIREMIRLFVRDDQYHKAYGPLWKRFLYQRDTLLERTTKLTSAQDDESYWDEEVVEKEFEWE